jgi:hypothetical protein
MSDPFLDTSRNLARWLQEAGRRTRRKSKTLSTDPNAAEPRESAGPAKGAKAYARWPILLGVLALAFLQYFYASTYLDIESIRSLIVFVLVNGQLPPV